MSTNVKPGDLAVIVRPTIPENVGIIVEVLDRAPLGVVNLPEGIWAVEPSDGVCWIVESLGRKIKTKNGYNFDTGAVQIAVGRDAQLMRLPRPDEMPEETVEHDSAPVAHA